VPMYRAHRRFIGPYMHQPKLPSPLVILSEAKDLTRWAEMLRCTQHDNAAVYELMRIFADSSAHNKGSHALML